MPKANNGWYGWIRGADGGFTPVFMGKNPVPQK